MYLVVKPLCIFGNNISNIIRVVLKSGCLTGSRKFGLFNEKSDWDYFIKYELISDFVDLKFLKKYHESSDLPTLSFNIFIFNGECEVYPADKVINVLVCLSDGEYNAWFKSTEQFVNMLRNDDMLLVAKSKDVRVAIFEELRRINGIGDKERIMGRILRTGDEPF